MSSYCMRPIKSLNHPCSCTVSKLGIVDTTAAPAVNLLFFSTFVTTVNSYAILALLFAKLTENQFSVLDIFAIVQKKTLAGSACFVIFSSVVLTRYHMVSGLLIFKIMG